MLSLFQLAVHELACVQSTVAGSAMSVLIHVRIEPLATASSADGSESARATSGLFGFWMSSDLHPATVTAARMPSPRASRVSFIFDLLIARARGSVAEFEHHGDRAVRRVGEVVHTLEG